MSRQYLSAGGIVEEVAKGRSLKSYCASKDKLGKVDYAIALQTLKYKETIVKLLAACSISAESLDVREGVLMVMVYELLFGEGKISGGGSVKRKITEHIGKLREALSTVMVGKSSHTELLPQSVLDHAKIGAFIRVNTVKVGITEGIDHIQNICPAAKPDSEIPSLVALPSTMTSFGQDEWVKSGKLVIQDKASCFPSQVLFDAWAALPKVSDGVNSRGDLVDACAAPGNKTSHLAALVSGAASEAGEKASSVYAFEKNHRRAQLLRDRMALMGVQDTVKVNNCDFLTIDVLDAKYRNVTAVLLDPSCSGSGVVRSLERAVENSGSIEDSDTRTDRLAKLQAFQISVIQKAMTFPRVQRIVYSTCSVHVEENEFVVAEILRQFGVPTADPTTETGKSKKKKKKDKAASSSAAQGEVSGWRVAAPVRLKQWKRRGLPFTAADQQGAGGPTLTAVQRQALVRCAPEDGTNGFFVCLFERVGPLPPFPEPSKHTVEASKAVPASNSGVLSGQKRQASEMYADSGSVKQKQAQHVRTAEPVVALGAAGSNKKHKQERAPGSGGPAGNSFFGGKRFSVQKRRNK